MRRVSLGMAIAFTKVITAIHAKQRGDGRTIGFQDAHSQGRPTAAAESQMTIAMAGMQRALALDAEEWISNVAR